MEPAGIINIIRYAMMGMFILLTVFNAFNLIKHGILALVVASKNENDYDKARATKITIVLFIAIFFIPNIIANFFDGIITKFMNQNSQ